MSEAKRFIYYKVRGVLTRRPVDGFSGDDKKDSSNYYMKALSNVIYPEIADGAILIVIK